MWWFQPSAPRVSAAFYYGVSMGLYVRLTLPVFVLMGLMLLLANMSDADRNLRLVVVLGGLICTTAIVGQVLKLREFLSELPSVMKDTVWESPPASFPQQSAKDGLGHFTREMRDLAFSMREVFAQRAEMEQMAYTDALTNLPNRRGLNVLLNRFAASSGQATGGLGMLHLDLDHFKAVNDRFGHDAGDHVLREATILISAAIRDSDYLARLGGDEFVVVAPGVDNDNVLIRIADRILEKFETPIPYEERQFELGISIGMVLGGLRGKLLDPQRLLLNADIALCHAKANGRNRHAMFSPTMARSNRRHQNQAEEIRKGLEQDAFQPWFAPVCDVATGQTVALRVCPRWENSAHGFIDPEDFMTTASTFNMVEELCLRVLEHSCKARAGWGRSVTDVPKLQFSLNRALLLDTGIADKISWCLDDTGLSPTDLALCVAETSLSGRNSEVVHANLKRLQALGCSIILDEFGAENGSFSHVSALKPSGIVASGKLTDNLGSESLAPSSIALLQGLVGGAGALGITVAAKNVESPSQSEILTNLGIRLASGAEISPLRNALESANWLSMGGHSGDQADGSDRAISA